MQKLNLSTNNSKINVFKASAGSGKTFKITEEYLLLILDEKKPYNYRNILAVTFTNKATDEMKSRIITELSKLANNEKSPYIETLKAFYDKDEAAIRLLARDVLVKILHDYSSFYITTIDKFFQQIMRSFTREIGLDGNYVVELDSKKILSESIDLLLSELEQNSNTHLLGWLIKFSEDKIENGKTWNIRDDIKKLGNEIFGEDFRVKREEIQNNLQDKEFVEKYKKNLDNIIHSFQNNLIKKATKFNKILEKNQLEIADFRGGSRSCFSFINKLIKRDFSSPSDTFKLAYNTIENWYTKKTPQSTIDKIESVYPMLNQLVGDILEIFNKEEINYLTAKKIDNYFYTLSILGDIDNKVAEYTSSNNLLLLSNTTEILNKIIANSDTPFIYEKIGQIMHHYMIDEFQDTSGMQWRNFHPLLKESIDNARKNFIVGDIKQSIYRWRNSDWSLLDSQIDKDFKQEDIHHETLITNWRSSPNIIKFNNQIFSEGAKKLQNLFDEINVLKDNSDCESCSENKIIEIFDDVIQEVPTCNADKPGYVKVEFVEKKSDTEWKEEILEKIPSEIEFLKNKGFELKDIAILVRDNKDGTLIADYLLKAHYDVISNEALLVCKSQYVKLIVSLLEYMISPDEPSLKVLAVCEYLKLREKLSSEDALSKYFSDNYDFPQSFKNKLEDVKKLSLYEMVETLLELFFDNDTKDDLIYVQAFLDILLEYSSKYNGDVALFVKWWKEVGITKKVSSPEGQNAIQIMTIHKSKGLGFEAVIIPFCNWEINNSRENILWCKPKEPPFNTMHLVPIRYSKDLLKTHFAQDYISEFLRTTIDNANLLYVAFTRAKKALIIFGQKKEKKDKQVSSLKNVSDLLYDIITEEGCNQNDKFLNLENFFDSEKNALILGEDIKLCTQSNNDISDEVSMKNFPSISFDNRLKLRLSNQEFFTVDEKREYGILLHEILSNINTVDDVHRSLSLYIQKGIITEGDRSQLTELLISNMTKETVKDWFDGKYQVLNEQNIILPDGKNLRPDRVMMRDGEIVIVDYKFGNIESSKYINQMKQYIHIVKEMGYNDVKGYIDYITLNKLIKVD